MQRLVIKGAQPEILIAQEVLLADTFQKRLIGLLGRNSFPSESTLWIQNCDSIHCFFMKFPIGAVFVDHHLVVKKVVECIKPNRMTLPVFGAQSVFEFSTENRAYRHLKVGDQLHVGY